MKNKVIRILTLLVCFVMVFSLAACSGNGGGTVDNGNTPGGDTPGGGDNPGGGDTPGGDEPSALPDKVSGTLNVYISLNEDEVTAYRLVADEYMAMQAAKGNNVVVNVDNNTSADSYKQSIEGKIAMGVDEAAIVKTGTVNSYYGTSTIVDLAPYLAMKNPYADGQVWRDVLEPEAYAPKYARGKTSVPNISYDTNYLVAFYDKRVMADLGITEIPTTWQGMLDCLEKASKDPDFKKPMGLGVDPESGKRTFLAWVIQMYMDQYFRDFIDVAHSQKGDYSYSSRIDRDYVYDPNNLSLGLSSGYTYNLNRVLDGYFNNTDEYGPLSPRFKEMMSNLRQLLPYIDTKASYGDLFSRFNETASSYADDGTDNGTYHDRKLFYIQRLDYVLSYKTAFKLTNKDLSPEQISERLGWFALPPMPNNGGEGAPAANNLRSLGGVESELGILNSNNQANTDLAIDFLAYFYSPAGMNIRLQSLSMTGTPLVMNQLVKGITIPENIDLVTGSGVDFEGNCQLNPYLQVGYGYSNDKITIGSTNNTVIQAVADNFSKYFRDASGNWANYGGAMLKAVQDGFKNFASDQRLIFNSYENIRELTNNYQRSPFAEN